MKLIYLSALDAKVVGKTGSLVRSKVLQTAVNIPSLFSLNNAAETKQSSGRQLSCLKTNPTRKMKI